MHTRKNAKDWASLCEVISKTNSLMDLGKYGDAVICYDNFFNELKEIKTSKLIIADLWIWRGECLRRLGRFNEAIKSYNNGNELLDGMTHEVAWAGMELAKEGLSYSIYTGRKHSLGKE